MSVPNTTRWIGIGLLGLSLYGVLTFFSSLNPQPDYNTHLEAWARYITTTHYVIEHLFLSVLGLIFAIFGVFALGAYLATSYAPRLGLVAMVMTVLGSALLLVVLTTTAIEGQPVTEYVGVVTGDHRTLAPPYLPNTDSLAIIAPQPSSLVAAGQSVTGPTG